MSKVQFTQENIKKCRCGICPVQAKSQCVRDLMGKLDLSGDQLPDPKAVPGLYCSSGKATCPDLDENQSCICPTCPVWEENKLTSMYFCLRGEAK